MGWHGQVSVTLLNGCRCSGIAFTYIFTSTFLRVILFRDTESSPQLINDWCYSGCWTTVYMVGLVVSVWFPGRNLIWPCWRKNGPKSAMTPSQDGHPKTKPNTAPGGLSPSPLSACFHFPPHRARAAASRAVEKNAVWTRPFINDKSSSTRRQRQGIPCATVQIITSPTNEACICCL